MTRGTRALAGLLALVCVAPAFAQEPPAETGTARRVAFDTVSGWQDSFGEDADWPTQVIVDAFVGAELAPGWQVSVRPVVWRLRGEWEVILDQASVRYEVRRGASWRFEAARGRSGQPGGGILAGDRRFVTTGERGLGGGITPRQGLRVGVAGARGRYAEAVGARPALDYSTVNAEADLAFGYTRISGEWVRSRFDAPGGTRVSEGWTAQVQHTLTPRVFVHSRASHVRAPRAVSAFATHVEWQRLQSTTRRSATCSRRRSPCAPRTRLCAPSGGRRSTTRSACR